ncbi:uncharacterized protein LOC62_06G008317 [Vanrija pseudolonga]|uniref:Ubiquitin-like domain-containing protein n=1 Tax=Vanrija pseudolonga TaxID=143232 RepID=A0AAF1BKL8_9TREE|nr:hypothetical protein LOC62_06G008317 [Vanrija pseudolonga]
MILKVRTLTGKEVEIDVQPEWQVSTASAACLRDASLTHTDQQGQGERRGEGGYPSRSAASDLRWQGHVSRGFVGTLRRAALPAPRHRVGAGTRTHTRAGATTRRLPTTRSRPAPPSTLCSRSVVGADERAAHEQSAAGRAQLT